MNYFSLNDKSQNSNFENAVLKGLAPDRGLYFPQEINKLPPSFFENFKSKSKYEIAFEVIKGYVGDEIPEAELKQIIDTTLDFEFPVVELTEDTSVLELFHGPTLAFKDVGARFMAGCLGYFIKRDNLGKITVLVATSGDTGGAVANGFFDVEGIEVVILYPKGKVSLIQEKQLTTLGRNITALEVDGVFDDCQEMVKLAFLDEEIQEKRRLTSANSINVARWLPQMFYYFLAYQQLMEKDEKLVFSVPSGNFGNICAGLLAREMGLPIDHFIAANNVNNVVERFLQTEKFEPRSSIQTLSNAMDVGNPSNFVRILELFQNKFGNLQEVLSGYSFDDTATSEAIAEMFKKTGYVMDPHGAVGYLGLKSFLKENNGFHGTFLETAHPVKFLDTVEAAIQEKIEIPAVIRSQMKEEKKSFEIKTYEELKAYLLS
ncbi:threonine synthase [Gillisia limnaea]|uniref:Threonine synthase n=1 Tax=Gillisia limnaea (strain DSM 15749 / LMG 21470 / R-8282) TaxID=865937 RepID=H2BRI6_GILLR|nr:threonine synthase [Gillisia limnaea]EHQ04505.1 threonine synthase [Gillisia limnaea DSM 15749]